VIDQTERQVIRFSDNSSKPMLDSLAVEEPLEIWLKQHTSLNLSKTDKLLTTMRTPGDDESLARGWLHSSGLVDYSDVASIQQTGIEVLKGRVSNRIIIQLKLGVVADLERIKRFEDANSSCGVCGQESIEFLLDNLPESNRAQRFSLPQTEIYRLTQKLRDSQTLFGKTGGCHGAALFDADCNIVDVKEDVGRHNALDKLIGAQLAKLPGQFGIVLSGRVSFELVQKAAMAGISIIVAVGAPSSLAVDLCVECDICLVGFITANKFNVYHSNRQLAQY
jgi:FdhD protein